MWCGASAHSHGIINITGTQRTLSVETKSPWLHFVAFEKPQWEGGNYSELLAELLTEIRTSLVWSPGIMSTSFASKACQLFETAVPQLCWALQRSGSTSTATVLPADVKGSCHHLPTCPIQTESLIVNRSRNYQRWKGKQLMLAFQLVSWEYEILNGKAENKSCLLGNVIVWMGARMHPAAKWAAANVLFEEELKLSLSKRQRY